MNRTGKATLILLGLILAVGYAYRFMEDNKTAMIREFGLHGIEKWGTGAMRWTWKRSRIVASATADILGIEVYNHPAMKAGPAGTPLKIILEEKELESVNLQRGAFRGLYYYLPGIKGREIALRLELGNTVIPRDIGEGNDFRQLGIAASPLRFFEIMPPEGIGFYSIEEWNDTVPGIGSPEPLKVRWTGKRASLPADEITRSGEALFIKCLHPDCSEKPVALTILRADVVLSEVMFNNHEWKCIHLGQTEFDAGANITFVVSRTWNPKALGVNEDTRDLGLAVAFTWK